MPYSFLSKEYACGKDRKHNLEKDKDIQDILYLILIKISSDEHKKELFQLFQYALCKQLHLSFTTIWLVLN